VSARTGAVIVALLLSASLAVVTLVGLRVLAGRLVKVGRIRAAA
jgi:hypothetical protein